MTDPERRAWSRRDFLLGAGVGVGAAAGVAALGRSDWFDDPERPPPLYEGFVDSYWMETSRLREDPLRAPLRGAAKADVAIVGGGFTGLATAIAAARRRPGRRVVLLEGARCGYGASGRNGGFADVNYMGFPDFAASHPPEIARGVYDAIGTGLAAIERLVVEHGVDCELERNGGLRLAATDVQVEALERAHAMLLEMEVPVRLVDGAELQSLVRTERFHTGLLLPDTAILHPGKLVRGMARVAESLGVQIHEGSRVVRIEPGTQVRITTELGRLDAAQAVLATNGYTPQLGIHRNRLLPLCNYVIATEPLSRAQWDAIGWSQRHAIADARVLFMYLRPTADGRIVAGGESAVYYSGGLPSSGNHAPTLAKLERSLVETFPALEGVRVAHAWGGTMAFTSDFTPRIGSLDAAPNCFAGLGYCGEGVVMSQVAGHILAAMLDGEGGEFAGLPFVGGSPPWLGPEPFRTLGVKGMERALLALAGEG